MGDVAYETASGSGRQAVVARISDAGNLLFSRRPLTVRGDGIRHGTPRRAIVWGQFRVVGPFAENWDNKDKFTTQVQQRRKGGKRGGGMPGMRKTAKPKKKGGRGKWAA